MSKSLNNFLTIREVLADHHQEVLRFFVFSTHYRTPLDYSESALKDSATGLERLYSCIGAIDELTGSQDTPATISKQDREKGLALESRFTEAMDNDFNTAQGLGLIFDTVKDLNRIRQSLPANPAADDVNFLKDIAAMIRKLSAIMGLLTEPAAEFLKKRQQGEISELGISPEEIEDLINQRIQARHDKNWARADEIRDLLLAKGVELEDGPQGTTWKTIRK